MKKQPNPKKNKNPPIVDLVIKDMLSRKKLGKKRYGVYLQAGNGRNALQDAYEEALDLCMYLKQAMEENYQSVFLCSVCKLHTCRGCKIFSNECKHGIDWERCKTCL